MLIITNDFGSDLYFCYRQRCNVAVVNNLHEKGATHGYSVGLPSQNNIIRVVYLDSEHNLNPIDSFLYFSIKAISMYTDSLFSKESFPRNDIFKKKSFFIGNIGCLKF